MRAFALGFGLLGAYLIAVAFGIVVDDSRHMGSIIRLQKPSVLAIEGITAVQQRIRAVVSEGEPGFDLLQRAVVLPVIGGFALIGAGVVVWRLSPRRQRSQPAGGV